MANRPDAMGLATDIILEIFRLDAALTGEGDRLTRDIGLTSARWKVLGAISLAQRPLTIAQIARSMGLARQSVHRLVGELHDAKLLVASANPDHRRAALFSMTPAGKQAFQKAMTRQELWLKSLLSSAKLSTSTLTATRDALRRFYAAMLENIK